MRQLLLTLTLLTVLHSAYSQSTIQRSSGTNTIIEPRLQASQNFFIPSYTDTTSANIQRGIDSPSAIIKIGDSSMFIRGSNPRRWVRLTGKYLVSTVAALPTLIGVQPDVPVLTTDVPGQWYYDPTDTVTADNYGTVRVNGIKRIKRIYSGRADIRWFGAVGDGVTDNYNVFHNLFTNNLYPAYLYIPKGNFYTSKADTIRRFIDLAGEDSYDGPTTSIITYPKGVSGPVSYTTDGLMLERMTIQSTLPTGANLLEYNPVNHTMLYLPVLNAPVAGNTYEFYNPYDSTNKATGTAKINSIVGGLFKFELFTSPVGTFQIGDSIKGATSGASAKVMFVSQFFNLVAVGIVNGSFTVGETITGTISGATAKFYQENYTNTTRGVLVANVINETGNINVLNYQNKRVVAFRETGTASTGVTLNRHSTLKNVTVTGFGGDGIFVTSIDGNGANTNANLTKLYNVRVTANSGSAIKVLGGDANFLTIEGSTLVNNRGYAVNDQSFLGISVNGTQEDYNIGGGYNSSDYINRHSVYNNPYSEGSFQSSPYYSPENFIAGGSFQIGGTRGLPNYKTQIAVDYSDKNIQNNNIYQENAATDSASTVMVQQSGVRPAFPLTVEQTGYSTTDRGPGIRYRGPNTNTGTVGTELTKTVSTAFEYGNESLVQNSGSGFSHRIAIKRNPPPNITVTGTGGSGAVLVPDILNGTITKVNILTKGDNYPLNGTTITVPSMTGVNLQPIIQDGHIVAVTIVNGGSGGLDTDIKPSMETVFGGYRPMTTGVGTLGDTLHRFSDIWVNNLHAVTGVVTSLQSVAQSGNTSTIPLVIQGNSIGAGGGNVAGNLAIGGNALNSNTTGNKNTAAGYYALSSILTNIENTAFGYQAGANLTTDYNTAFGSRALYSATTGTRNTVVGQTALYYNTGGSYNTIVGMGAGQNAMGDANTLMGYNAGFNLTGANNTMFGYNTGGGITTGAFNTIIGSNVTGLATNLSNNVIISDGNGNVRFQASPTATKLPNLYLSGAAQRMVTTDSLGNLAAQAIPSGSVTSVATNNGILGGTITTTGTLSLDTTLASTKAYRQKGIDSLQSNINAKQNSLTLTTTGTSGAATLTGATLNIPNYATGSGTVTSVATNNGTGITGGTITTTGTLANDTTNVLSTKAYRQKGLDSAVSLINTKQNTLSLSTAGTGLATLAGSTLTIPYDTLNRVSGLKTLYRASQDSAAIMANMRGTVKVLPDANYTVTSSDRTLILTTPAATRTLTLPAASTMANQEINIQCRATTTGAWMLSGSFVQKGTTGSNPIAENFVSSGLATGVNYRLFSDGNKWYEQ